MRKAYIGPLGDDFPSLFPLLLGLMLFFGAVSLTYQTYDSKTDQIDSLRANVMLSRAVRSQRHMTYDYWETYACPLLQSARSNYGVKAAMIVNRTYYSTYDPTGNNYVLDRETFLFQGDPSKPAVCVDGPNTIINWKDTVPKGETTKGRNFVSMTYPVIVDVGVEKLTAELIVITWK